jgi:hypothetical protein
MTEEEHLEQLREQQNWEDECAQQELRAVVVSVFGGICAMSPDLYEEALRLVAEQCGRVVDEMFRNEVTEELRKMPCPLD